MARKWRRLALAAAALALFLAAAHRTSPLIPGAAGNIFRRNLDRRIDAAALFYTESGDVRDYLDQKKGRYATRTP
ncbi:MAG: hypothetical protein ABIJ96_18715 [Elusimicrobiota bacterium]